MECTNYIGIGVPTAVPYLVTQFILSTAPLPLHKRIMHYRVSRVVTDHVLLQYVRATFRLCPFLVSRPDHTPAGVWSGHETRRLDWHVIQRSQKQELLGTYAFSISTIAGKLVFRRDRSSESAT